MATETEYRDRIRQYDRDDLAVLWQSILDGNTPDWAPGKALEYLVLRAFELEGADVRWPYSVVLGAEEIEQVDGVVYAEGISSLLECKDWVQRASVEPIAKLRNQLSRRPSTVIGVVISIAGFTEAATILARFIAPETILLWSGDDLTHALRKQSMIETLVAKYRYCVETGMPDFSVLSEEVP